ncbi:MAG: lysylphosphatidylglycerol synthase transmembrane domain-containing protein [Anaerolineae bacterium]|jgi:uncharacterized membrane protein YbhN (UPF0104 family)
MKKRHWMQGLAGLLVGGVCLWFSLSGVDTERVVQQLGNIAWPWIGVATVGVVLVSAGKALRWQWLYPPLVRPLPWVTHFAILLVAQMLNLVVPVRMGEIARLGLMQQEGRPVGTTLSTVAVEKSLDLIAAGALLALLVPMALLPGWLRSTTGLGVFLTGLGLLGALLLAGGLRRSILRWVAALRPAPSERQGRWSRWLDPLFRLVETTLEGLAGLEVWRLLGVLVLTGVIWLTSVAVMRVMLAAFAIGSGWTAGLVLVLVIAFSNLAPTPPALIGLIGAVTQEALTPFGVPRYQALALGTMLNVVLVGPPVIMGGWVAGVRLLRLVTSKTSHRLRRALGLTSMNLQSGDE